MSLWFTGFLWHRILCRCEDEESRRISHKRQLTHDNGHSIPGKYHITLVHHHSGIKLRSPRGTEWLICLGTMVKKSHCPYRCRSLDTFYPWDIVIICTKRYIICTETNSQGYRLSGGILCQSFTVFTCLPVLRCSRPQPSLFSPQHAVLVEDDEGEYRLEAPQPSSVIFYSFRNEPAWAVDTRLRVRIVWDSDEALRRHHCIRDTSPWQGHTRDLSVLRDDGRQNLVAERTHCRSRWPNEDDRILHSRPEIERGRRTALENSATSKPRRWHHWHAFSTCDGDAKICWIWGIRIYFDIPNAQNCGSDAERWNFWSGPKPTATSTSIESRINTCK